MYLATFRLTVPPADADWRKLPNDWLQKQREYRAYKEYKAKKAYKEYKARKAYKEYKKYKVYKKYKAEKLRLLEERSRAATRPTTVPRS